jgi:hypothetical protein
MPSSFWDDVKKTLKDGIEKTEEYTKIGKLKVDILGIKRNMDKAYTELGREVSTIAEKTRQGPFQSSETMKKCIAQIKEHKAAIHAKEKDIENLKKEDSGKSPAADKKTPAKPPSAGTKQKAPKKSPPKPNKPKSQEKKNEAS